MKFRLKWFQARRDRKSRITLSRNFMLKFSIFITDSLWTKPARQDSQPLGSTIPRDGSRKELNALCLRLLIFL